MNSLATAFSAAFTFTKAPGIPHSVAVLLLALLCVALAGQTVHAGFLMMQTNRRTTRWHRVFELCMIVSLLVSALFLFSVAQMRHTLVAHFGSIALSLWPLLWMHAITFAAGIGAAIAQKRPSLLIPAILMLVQTPLLTQPESPLWAAAFAAITVFFAARSLFYVLRDLQTRKQYLSYFAAIETMNELPEGVLCYDNHGVILDVNPAMRTCLRALNLPCDYEDARPIPQLLAQLAQESQTEALRYGDNHRVEMPNGTVRLFVQEQIMLGRQPFTLITAFDITETERLSQQLAQTNRQLLKTQEELRASLANVQEMAENDALLYLHSRVHDIIGQRLSILHRYLEDDGQSQEAFDRIRPLLDGVLDDLENDEAHDARAELFAIRYAFSLIDVDIDVQGELPANPRVAEAFVQVIREASTNAVKHAQATQVSVTMDATPQEYRLTVTNNGEPFHGELRQGKGLPGMARAILSAGGQMSLVTEGAFTLQATVPHKPEKGTVPFSGFTSEGATK